MTPGGLAARLSTRPRAQGRRVPPRPTWAGAGGPAAGLGPPLLAAVASFRRLIFFSLSLHTAEPPSAPLLTRPPLTPATHTHTHAHARAHAPRRRPRLLPLSAPATCPARLQAAQCEGPALTDGGGCHQCLRFTVLSLYLCSTKIKPGSTFCDPHFQ